ncbi:MAG: acyltransferase [Candidatus Aenigmatarchaeota archaeon]
MKKLKYSKIVDVIVGEKTEIRDHVNLYKCKIGNNCIIHPFVEIEEGVIIGNNCKIHPFVYIPTGVIIEDDVFIGSHVCFTNDKYPRATNPDGSIKSKNDWKLLKTLVKKGASIGSGSVIGPGVTIGEYAMVGMGSVVTRDVPPYKLVMGNPAREVGDVFDKEEIMKYKMRK